MTYEEFEQLKIGNVVVCLEPNYDLSYGWSDEMDHIVGEPLTVLDYSIEGNSIRIQEPKHGHTYTFDHESLELWKNLNCYTPFEYKNHILVQLKPCNIGYLNKLYIKTAAQYIDLKQKYFTKIRPNTFSKFTRKYEDKYSNGKNIEFNADILKD